jgi:hypothetical protein
VINGLDHIVVLVDDIKAGAKAYELLLGRAPCWRSHGDGSETVLFALDNVSLELMAPAGNSPTANRIRNVINIWGEGSPVSVSASAISKRLFAGSIGWR